MLAPDDVHLWTLNFFPHTHRSKREGRIVKMRWKSKDLGTVTVS